MPELGIVTSPERMFFKVDASGASLNGAPLKGEKFLAGLGDFSVVSSASAQAAPALTGTVSSVGEGSVEGIAVTARAEGATIGTTVFTDAAGLYSFPAGLAPGRYLIDVEASGYERVAPALVELGASQSAELDITLVPSATVAAN
jgi:hypothetical protein